MIHEEKKIKEADVVRNIVTLLRTEFNRNDKGGIYAMTQYNMAYNSNKIEGSRLTKRQTICLFETRMLNSDDEYRAKDVEEATGHFLMFNQMLKTLEQPLSEKIIKDFHYQLKAGVFEDRANGYNIGEYKSRANVIAGEITVLPENVSDEMNLLINDYNSRKLSLENIVRFHAEYELIHPFQDGNGRTGRMIMFRECLKAEIIPILIFDDQRMSYYEGLQEYRTSGKIEKILSVAKEAQKKYYDLIVPFLEVKLPIKQNFVKHKPQIR